MQCDVTVSKILYPKCDFSKYINNIINSIVKVKP